MQALREQIWQLFAPVLEEHAVDFVDLELRGSARNILIKTYIDVPGGIKIKQCAMLSRELSDVLEIAEVIPGDYRLEVSSPGLDRPLRTERDFFRNIGRNVQISVSGESGKLLQYAGEIIDTSDGRVSIRKKSGEVVQFPVAEIQNARLQIKWS